MQLLNFQQKRSFSLKAGKDFMYIHTDQLEEETNASYKRVQQQVLSCSAWSCLIVCSQPSQKISITLQCRFIIGETKGESEVWTLVPALEWTSVRPMPLRAFSFFAPITAGYGCQGVEKVNGPGRMQRAGRWAGVLWGCVMAGPAVRPRCAGAGTAEAHAC